MSNFATRRIGQHQAASPFCLIRLHPERMRGISGTFVDIKKNALGTGNTASPRRDEILIWINDVRYPFPLSDLFRVVILSTLAPRH